MIADTKYRWRYLLPASDRFFNRIFQNEDIPAGDDDDHGIASLVSATCSHGKTAVSADREPDVDGRPLQDPCRIRYCRILPLRIDIACAGEAVIDIDFATPHEVGKARRLHLWFLSFAELAEAGGELWLRTTEDDLQLDGECAGRRWTFLEKQLTFGPQTKITGLRLVVKQAVEGTCYLDGLRLGEPHGFRPFVEPHCANGALSVVPPELERGTCTPLTIRYELESPLQQGERLELVAPVGWLVQNSTPDRSYLAEVTLRGSPEEQARSVACRCGKKWDTRWRGMITLTLDTALDAGAQICFRIRNIDWQDAANNHADNRSFRLYLMGNSDNVRRKHVHNPAVCFTGGQPGGFNIGKPKEHIERDGLQPLFGYLHAHSDISEDGRQSPVTCYRFARDVAKLDFCALSDHFWAHEPLWKWDLIKETADKFNREGEFATLLGYEWSSQDFGDRNVYFAGADGPPCPVEPIESTPNELYEQLEDQEALIIPHSPAFEIRSRGIDWDFHHPGLERLVEVFSAHGSSEGVSHNTMPLRNRAMGPECAANSVRAALDRGLKLGIIAGGDDHIRPNPQGTGLTAVWARSRSRRDIFQALYERRCYGTTALAIVVEFRVNNAWMGSTVLLDSLRIERHYCCSMKCHAPLETLEWIKNGRVETVLRPLETAPGEYRIHWQDSSLITPNEYVYVKGYTADGHIFWTSPVWFRVREDTPCRQR